MKTSNKILLALVFIAFGLFGYIYFSFASVIVDQTLSGTSAGSASTGSNTAVDQGLGTGLSGNFSSVRLKAQASSTGVFRVFLYECTTAVRTSCTGSVWNSSPRINTTALTDYYASSAVDYALDASKYYFIDIDRNDGGTVSPNGTTSNNYSNGACTRLSGGVWGSCSNSVLDLYFIAEGTQLGVDTRTHIDWVYPIDGTMTASRTIDFELEYYFNSTTHDDTIYTKVLIQACSLINVNPFNQDLNTCERIIIEDEILNYDTLVQIGITQTLKTDGAYLLIAEFWNGVATPSFCSWWEFTCDAQEVKVLVPNAINVNIATEAISFDSILDAVGTGKTATSILCGADDADWYNISDLTAGYICKVLVFLFYPDATLSGQNNQLNALWNNLGDKLPFALYFAPYDKYYEMSSTTASASFAVYTMPIMGLATMSFDFKTFKDEHGDFLDLWAVPISYFMWFWFGLFVFRDLTSKK